MSDNGNAAEGISAKGLKKKPISFWKILLPVAIGLAVIV